jgi:hypothetical protein
MSSGGQVVGGLVGAVAGFFLGGGTPSGALYGAQIGMTLGGYLDPPKGPTVNGPRLNDLSVQTSTYGAVIPRVYGTVTGQRQRLLAGEQPAEGNGRQEEVGRQGRWRQDDDAHLYLLGHLCRRSVPGADCRRAPDLGRSESDLRRGIV